MSHRPSTLVVHWTLAAPTCAGAAEHRPIQGPVAARPSRDPFVGRRGLILPDRSPESVTTEARPVVSRLTSARLCVERVHTCNYRAVGDRSAEDLQVPRR